MAVLIQSPVVRAVDGNGYQSRHGSVWAEELTYPDKSGGFGRSSPAPVFRTPDGAKLTVTLREGQGI
jgi:hypothetical protein